MRRRDFITLMGTAAGSWPINAPAQDTLPSIGVVPAYREPFWSALRAWLNQHGYAEGRNIRIEFRSADGNAAAVLDETYRRAARFDLVINLKAAKELGPELPPTLVAGANEVIA